MQTQNQTAFGQIASSKQLLQFAATIAKIFHGKDEKDTRQ